MRDYPRAQVLEHVADHEEGEAVVRPSSVRLDELVDQLHAHAQAVRHERVGVVLHQGADHLAACDAQIRPLLLVLVYLALVVVGLLRRPPALLVRVADLEGGAHGLESHLADVLDLIGRQHSAAGLLEARGDAIGRRLQPLQVEVRVGPPEVLELGQNPLEELLHQLPDDVGVAALSRGLAQQAPRVEGQVADLLGHREVEDQQQRLGSLCDERRVHLAQLLHEGVDT
mmetsp:Transcript_31895/g.91931  ORF Transcript_31895/g.91931 Transcript_31895/m.91931 type:complete len:228 (-) Transcript_31895:2114-2797(-)